MKRLTILAAAMLMLAGVTGCATTGHKGCKSCQSQACGSADCNVSTGCRACKLGWQHGGLDYSEGLATGNPHHMAPGRQSPAVAGPPTAGVAYPYYTVRGPRDFLLDNPPSVGR